jgi:FHA domain
MLDFLKQQQPKDVKLIRSNILDFIKDQLKKAEGGEGSNIRGLQLYITCASTEKHLYEAALYTNEEDRFKNDEVQKIADDFAIHLPQDWAMEILFDEAPPQETIKANNVEVALFISTQKKRAIHKERNALIKVLHGEAEKEFYNISSKNERINIGRESKVNTADGFYRENTIAFPDSSNNKSNKSISRQHAHIEWDDDNSAFFLYADEGGVPPSNKIKVKSKNGQENRLLTTEIGHHLLNGDQIILGESALLEFNYTELQS